jgi:hypothetical protein
MTQSQFNTTKTELRSGLETIAKAVENGELSPHGAKGFKPHILELWKMEELGYDGYKRLSAVRGGIHKLKQNSQINRLTRFELRMLTIRANLRTNVRSQATETLIETRLDELASALRALRAADITDASLDFIEQQISELERMV